MSLKNILKPGYLLFFLLGHSLFSQVNFESSNLPIVVIDTKGQIIIDDPRIKANMGIIDNGAGNRNNIDDPLNNYDGKISIEISGSSSQYLFPKK